MSLLGCFEGNSTESFDDSKSKFTAVHVEDSRSLRLPDFVKSTREGGKIISPSTGRHYPQEIFLELIYVKG